MTEPDDFGLSPFQTLAHVGEPTRSIRHVSFWKTWTAGVFAHRPRLVARAAASTDPSDPSATHEFASSGHVRIGCSLLLPSRGRPKAGLIVTHGYSNVPSLAQSAQDWQAAADSGLAVLLVRVRGYAGSQTDAAQIVAHAAAPDGGGGNWITHGLEIPLSDRGLGSEWSFSYAVADVVHACRAMRTELGPQLPIFLGGESMGGALCVLASSVLADLDEVSRIAIGLPSMGDWPWRLCTKERRDGTGAGRAIGRFITDHASRVQDIGATLRVLDPVIHARRVRCPVFCKLATRDDAVPAPAAAAVFNALGADPGRKWRFVVKYGHFDGGLADLRRHALFDRLVREFLDPAHDPFERDWEAVALEPSMAPPGRRSASPEPPAESASLFGQTRASDPDEILIQAYFSTGRTLDDLPYTPEFDRIHRAIAAGSPSKSPREVFHKLHNLRKAGRLPRLGKPASKPPKIDAGEEQALAQMVAGAVGSLGQRDQLPYAPAFDAIVERFNQQTGRTLSPHDVWRLIAKLAK